MTSSWGWYCHEVASEKNGDIINSCGIAEAPDEDDARKKALENAYRELDLICNKSFDCAGFGLEITPLRTECKRINETFRCHRGITATINREKKISPELNIYVPKKVMQVELDTYQSKSTIVHFKSIPDGASVYVDGVETCDTPCSREIAFGQHKIIFDKKDHELLSFVEDISGEKTIEKDLELRYGFLKILDVPQGTTVKVDQTQVSSEGDIKLLPKNYVVTILSPHHQPWHQEIEIKKGKTLKIPFPNEPIWGYAKFSASDREKNAISANLYVDGEEMDEKTPTEIKIKSGKRKIKLSHPDFKDVEFEEEFESNKTTAIKKVLEAKNQKDWRLLLGLGVSGQEVQDFQKGESYSCCGMFEVGLQRMIWRGLGISLNYRKIASLGSEEDKELFPYGTPDTTEYGAEESQSNLFGVGLLYELGGEPGGAFFEGETGIGKGDLKYDEITYDQWGTGSRETNAGKMTYSERYVILAMGYDWLNLSEKNADTGLYIKAGVRLSTKKFDRPKDDFLEMEDLESKPVIGFLSLGIKTAF